MLIIVAVYPWLKKAVHMYLKKISSLIINVWMPPGLLREWRSTSEWLRMWGRDWMWSKRSSTEWGWPPRLRWTAWLWTERWAHHFSQVEPSQLCKVVFTTGETPGEPLVCSLWFNVVPFYIAYIEFLESCNHSMKQSMAGKRGSHGAQKRITCCGHIYIYIYICTRVWWFIFARTPKVMVKVILCSVQTKQCRCKNAL